MQTPNIYVFDIPPMAKPRMTRGDSWKKRPVVLRYWSFKDALVYQANLKGFVLPEAVKVTFVVPFSKSTTLKKRKSLSLTNHQQRPDTDNYEKALLDCLSKEDSYVYEIQANKIWADYEDERGTRGLIIVRELHKEEKTGDTLYKVAQHLNLIPKE